MTRLNTAPSVKYMTWHKTVSLESTSKVIICMVIMQRLQQICTSEKKSGQFYILFRRSKENKFTVISISYFESI